ncbi:hypothetical protein J2T02_002597 [Chitinophaga terrae (ex Kim and Jung 2007)]|uniref:hypothetical protein n=1 Tax=Chitinophaga terrae (ex Kim and Jung 2007) TaxID=408074 RepID=UPI0027851474|nr:hypothetical protein [Chitinophaga terrae (ex Kim and Jung 2007)]MDQ0107478.1 hypothetical protein [Chitinophaga terrae (ex Kim and Jung 2007)]
MNSIFNKLDNIHIEQKDLLPQDDLQYCDQLFDTYKATHFFALQTLDAFNRVHSSYMKQYPDTDDSPFKYQLKDLTKIQEKLTDVLSEITHHFIYELEGYFRDKYHLQFLDYGESHKLVGNALMDSYVPVIEHIIGQVGTNFIEAAATAVKQQFRKSVSFPSRRPTLSGQKVILPKYARIEQRYDETYRLENREDILLLLKVIYVFHGASIINQKAIPAMGERLYQKDCDFDNHVPVLDTYQLRFYKNGRVDIIFPSAATASGFLNTMIEPSL